MTGPIKTAQVSPTPSHPASWHSVRATLMRVAKAFARHRQRRHLSELSDHLLADVGLTRDDVKRERAKPFWRS